MKISRNLILSLFIGLSSSSIVHAQCVDENNVNSFTYNGNTYEVVLENKTWEDAAACALERGGYLIEINDSLEQAMIFGNLPIINFQNTSAPDGGNGGYLWIGANDIATEGAWIWDGDNSGSGAQFWSGAVNGSPVGGLYSNWGNEPDNFGSGQDAAAYAITNWPNGFQEEWNDVAASNSLYFIIEYTAASLDENQQSTAPRIFPNPAETEIRVASNGVERIVISNMNGTAIEKYEVNGGNQLEISTVNYPSGMYMIQYFMENGTALQERFVKL